MKPLLVTCVTESYLPYAKHLWAALDRQGYLLHIATYEDAGDWVTNTLKKPVTFHSAWLGNNGLQPAWLLDADLEPTGKSLDPLFALLDGADMAVHRQDEAWRTNPGLKVSAGVVGFNNTSAGKAAATYWAMRCARHLEGKEPMVKFPEQAELYRTAEFVEKSGGVVSVIDTRYNARPRVSNHPFDEVDPDEVVMWHTPASREMKK